MNNDFDNIWLRMTRGEVYDATHPELVRRLEATREKIYVFNQLRPSQQKEQYEILDSLLGCHGKSYHFNQPFRCDYGANIFIGENFFANFNLTILDEAEVHIGCNCFIGPNVSIYTACHPLDAETRNICVEWAEPVHIGDNVWIGGSATILPGVTVGNNVVIGAGSVVTKSFPDNVVIGGNPAKIIKRISPKDGHQQLGPDSCGA